MPSATAPEARKERQKTQARARYALKHPQPTPEERLANRRLTNRLRAMLWRQQNPEKAREKRRLYRNRRRAERPEAHKAFMRRRRVKTEYGLEWGAYQAMIAERGPNCPICNKESAPVVDHCHATGFVRGLICERCNNALGHAKDNPATLRRMADYLEQADAARLLS